MTDPVYREAVALAMENAKLHQHVDAIRAVLAAENHALHKAIEAVRALHSPTDRDAMYGFPPNGHMVCDYCERLNYSTEGLNNDGEQDWPCSTIQAIDDALGGGL